MKLEPIMDALAALHAVKKTVAIPHALWDQCMRAQIGLETALACEGIQIPVTRPAAEATSP